MPDSILSKGAEALYTIRDDLTELTRCKEKYMEAEDEENRLEKEVEAGEQQMENEISRTLEARKNEISGSYDEQIDNVKAQMKKINGRKEKQKTKKVSRRIEEETKSLVTENKQLSAEAKTVMKKGRIPRFFNTGYFSALIAPKGLQDFGFILLTLAVILLGIPFCIYFLLLTNPKSWMFALIYVTDIILFGGLYFYLFHITRGTHPGEIRSVKSLRNKIRINKKKMKAIKSSIVKDSDETPYGLEDFDRELETLDNKLSEIAYQKSQALKIFESETKAAIIEEITSQYRDGIDTLQADYNRAHQECLRLADEIKETSLTISNQYEGYLGKEFLTTERLTALIEQIESGQAKTISEAMSLLKKGR